MAYCIRTSKVGKGSAAKENDGYLSQEVYLALEKKIDEYTKMLT